MAKGRALAQLIMHMSHLTPVGWGYFACSVVLSGICYPSSKKMIPCFISAENGGYPPTQNGDIRSLFWLFSLMALQN